MDDIDVCVSSYLKEELAWAVDKRLWVISTVILFLKSTKELKGTKKAVLNLKTIVYVAMWPLVAYSNYFEIVSTVIFLVSRTRLIWGKFLFNTVIILYNDYARYNICSTWF